MFFFGKAMNQSVVSIRNNPSSNPRPQFTCVIVDDWCGVGTGTKRMSRVEPQRSHHLQRAFHNNKL